MERGEREIVFEGVKRGIFIIIWEELNGVYDTGRS